MKNEISKLVPEAVNKVIQKEVKDRNRRIIDLIIDDATAYGFNSEQVVPCIMAAYYAHQSAHYPSEMEDEWIGILVFYTAIRSAMKLLSYGKFKAKRSENGWMMYTDH
ncbi:hypothetical protein H9I32_13550 [Bacillus sp. Xin]|uniref:hypothetical protein n=1 Tax=unclassified Bacillus (in: firmicutes) TaxID=185979 RepID=UPI001571DE70|nr:MULTISPECIES: hypothetical protein [unclassified Bacillus (in: firmicutes)]MBC6973361.1 hypothetical protein [Bacillus sp. Xin]NSW35636.1 hypothetical protein [Bacillus sp. Xin1]